MAPRLRLSALALLAVLAACSAGFNLARYQTNEALYTAAVAQFEQEHWDNAIAAFERLTLQLPARDTLLPRSHWYLGQAHLHRDEQLLAAQSFVRLVESFPADTLADDALFEAARAYARMWRKPELSPEYGETAISTFQTLLSAYPDSPRVADAQREIARLHDWLAQKDFETGEYYRRRRAYDSAIIYYRDVVDQYPETPTAKRAWFALLDVYHELKYQEEAEEVCAGLRARYADDAAVLQACGPAPAAAPRAPPADTTGAAAR
ncbi:MAG TPA: outer membrane protein assembly factor BamD [Gemmatimonadaceae bacterium]|nr:outer membrane protein assembly factor BamD [Gemmatimonadaceae bacterium]